MTELSESFRARKRLYIYTQSCLSLCAPGRCSPTHCIFRFPSFPPPILFLPPLSLPFIPHFPSLATLRSPPLPFPSRIGVSFAHFGDTQSCLNRCEPGRRSPTNFALRPLPFLSPSFPPSASLPVLSLSFSFSFLLSFPPAPSLPIPSQPLPFPSLATLRFRPFPSLRRFGVI